MALYLRGHVGEYHSSEERRFLERGGWWLIFALDKPAWVPWKMAVLREREEEKEETSVDYLLTGEETPMDRRTAKQHEMDAKMIPA